MRGRQGLEVFVIDLSSLMAFIAAASILTATPGVDTAIVLRTSITDGKPSAVMAALGVALGCLIWGAAVSLGLGALLHASALAYDVTKFAGAAYLVWMGLKLVLNPRGEFESQDGAVSSRNGWEAFRRGLLANLLNPKVGVFYVTFLPQFVPANASVANFSFFLACIHVFLTLAWFGVLIVATMPLSRFLRQPLAMKALDRIAGGVLVAFGIKLATSSSR
jgi:threonine/homoserine/homoserine lactone efflux protein